MKFLFLLTEETIEGNDDPVDATTPAGTGSIPTETPGEENDNDVAGLSAHRFRKGRGRRLGK